MPESHDTLIRLPHGYRRTRGAAESALKIIFADFPQRSISRRHFCSANARNELARKSVRGIYFMTPLEPSRSKRHLTQIPTIASEPDREPVIGRLDARRQLPLQGLVVEVDMQIGQDGALGLYPRDPVEGLREMGVARMRRVAQGVDDPAFDAVERGERRFV